MNTQDKELLKNEVDIFLAYLQPDNKPQIFFIRRENVNEAKINDDSGKNIICFNMWFLERLAVDFAMLIVLHEIYHFTKQDIKNHQHIAELRYCQLWAFMQLYDIEADLNVVDYMIKGGMITNFPQYLEILHSGAIAFRNPTIRLVKLERFIGSLVTIKSFMNTGKHNLYLPKLSLNSIMMLRVN